MELTVWVFTLVVISTWCSVDCGVTLPQVPSLRDTRPDQTLPKHGLGQGFRYEVRYPPAPRTTPRQDVGGAQESRNIQDTTKFQQYKDGKNLLDTGMDATSAEQIFTEGASKSNVNHVSCGDGELDKEASDSGGYQYLQPSSKLTVTEETAREHRTKLDGFPDSTPMGVDSLKIFTDPLDSVPEGSEMREVTWMGEVSSNTLTSDPINLQVHPTEDQEGASAPETYSSVRFTGSFFTEEGLPVLDNNTELPVDYRFEYLIRGVPDLGHEESRVEDTARGRYWAVLPDGRLQEVTYVADTEGYRPTITYRQPGELPGVELS